MVFLLGFASMNIWWNVLPRNAELHGLYYYKAATWGDGICLPLLTGALYYICKYVRKSDNKKGYSIIGVFTGLLGFGVQVSWLLDNNIVLNWTIPKVHYFNVAGFWHAFSLYLCLAFWEDCCLNTSGENLKKKMIRWNCYVILLYGLPGDYF